MKKTHLAIGSLFTLALFFITAIYKASDSNHFLYFYSKNCRYCTSVSELIVKVDQDHRFKWVPVTEYTDETKKLQNRYRVASMPTIISVDFLGLSSHVVCDNGDTCFKFISRYNRHD